MKDIETKKEYLDYVDKKSPNSPILKNCFNAFWVGGLICSIGQIIFDFCKYKGFDDTACSTIVSITLIGIAAILTGLNIFNKIGHIKIGTKYPAVAKSYFEGKGMDVEIIKIEGSVELAPILGISEGIVDIMETGTTLKENGLVVVDEICDISSRVIVNKSSFKLKRNEINSFIDKIREVCN